MNINKILLLFLPLSFITTACSNTVNNRNSSYNQLPASIRLCYLNEKIIDSKGNSFQINNVYFYRNELNVQGEFVFNNFVNFKSINGFINEKNDESYNIFKIDVQNTSILNNLDFSCETISYNGSYTLVFDINDIYIEDIDSIHINFGINKSGYDETQFVISGNDISKWRD